MIMKLVSPNKNKIVLGDVKPNSGIEASYRKRLLTMIKAMNDSYVNELKLTSGEVDNPLAQDASPTEELKKVLKRLDIKWSKRFEEVADLISKHFVSGGMKHSDVAFQKNLKKAGFTVDFKMTKQMRELFKLEVQRNVDLIKSIQKKYHQDIQTKVWESVEKGGDVGELTKQIKNTHGVSESRAKLIARDQNAKAHGLFEETRRKELGLTRAIWVHSTAGKKPRKSHVQFNNKEYNISEGAYIDNEYIRPGQKINCRCTSKAIIPGFNDEK